MKYKCDLIRDLMPLCADDSAAEDSKKAVFEHMSECASCEEYYRELIRGIEVDIAQEDTLTSEYATIAKKIRKRKIKYRALIAALTFSAFLLLGNYAIGYHFTPRAAAEHSGKLNPSSKLLGTYDWGSVRFFFYEGDCNYDTISADRHWNGWRSDDNYFVWPKYPSDKGYLTVTSPLYYWDYDRGILLYPLLCDDPDITRVTITAFGKSKTTDIDTGKLTILAFENSDTSLSEDASGYAYDRHGNIKYELAYDESMGRWVWKAGME